MRVNKPTLMLVLQSVAKSHGRNSSDLSEKIPMSFSEKLKSEKSDDKDDDDDDDDDDESDESSDVKSGKKEKSGEKEREEEEAGDGRNNKSSGSAWCLSR